MNRVNRTVFVTNFDVPFFVRLKRIFDIASKPFSGQPGLLIVTQLFADFVFVWSAIGYAEKVS
jgi:hypothetical protein